jgi:hypothetical protein
MLIHIQRFLLAIIAALLVLPVLGCTQTTIPLPTAPPLYRQDKVQSADHWDTVANSVANRVQQTLEDRPDLIARPLYVQPPNNGVFVNTFASLLRSRLVSKGMQVSEKPEPDSLFINFNAQLVLHDESRGDSGISIAGLGVALGNVFTGGSTSPSDHELVINTAMVSNNRYVMSLSQVCYINDADWMLYFDPAILRQQGESADALWMRYAGRGASFGGGRTPAFSKPIARPPAQPSEYTVAQRSMELPDSQGRWNAPQTRHSSVTTQGEVVTTPIFEEFVMRPGGRMINPNATPTPIGKKRR